MDEGERTSRDPAFDSIAYLSYAVVQTSKGAYIEEETIAVSSKILYMHGYNRICSHIYLTHLSMIPLIMLSCFKLGCRLSTLGQVLIGLWAGKASLRTCMDFFSSMQNTVDDFSCSIRLACASSQFDRNLSRLHRFQGMHISIPLT